MALNLTYKWNDTSAEGKSDVYIINLKRTFEKLLLAAFALVAIENPADVSVISFGNTDQRAVLKLAAATMAGHFTPGNFTNRIKVANRNFQWLLIPALTTSLSEASYVHLPTITLYSTDSALCQVTDHPVRQGSSLGGSDMMGAGRGSSVHVWHHLL